MQFLRLGKTILSLLVLRAALAQADISVPDTIETRMLACAPCHGVQGRGTGDDYFPRLAGKPAGYLYNQLSAFRTGRRHYAPMNYLLEYQGDDYLKAMADYFSNQIPPAPPPVRDPTVNAEVLARGQQLATQGDAKSGIPACAACHNSSFTGMDPGIPSLVGLRRNYISAQLGAWRYGTRTTSTPDCMQAVASRLSENDVTALAAWLSTLPIPSANTRVPAHSLVMPLPCGSEPN